MNKLDIIDVEIIGYNNAKITPTPTDSHFWKGLKSASYRVKTNKMIDIDLGHGRNIKIILRANETELSKYKKDKFYKYTYVARIYNYKLRKINE
jgi:hypothetical protein